LRFIRERTRHEDRVERRSVARCIDGRVQCLARRDVKVTTPLGQRTGEFCAQDRAILFEDPTCVRILYDPGKTVAGAADPSSVRST
jgi:hypothetical protein